MSDRAELSVIRSTAKCMTTVITYAEGILLTLSLEQVSGTPDDLLCGPRALSKASDVLSFYATPTTFFYI